MPGSILTALSKAVRPAPDPPGRLQAEFKMREPGRSTDTCACRAADLVGPGRRRRNRGTSATCWAHPRGCMCRRDWHIPAVGGPGDDRHIYRRRGPRPVRCPRRRADQEFASAEDRHCWRVAHPGHGRGTVADQGVSCRACSDKGAPISPGRLT
jgi:hypothetical protein